MLADSIPAGEAQEARLREIESEIGKLKEEIKEVKAAMPTKGKGSPEKKGKSK